MQLKIKLAAAAGSAFVLLSLSGGYIIGSWFLEVLSPSDGYHDCCWISKQLLKVVTDTVVTTTTTTTVEEKYKVTTTI